jgi:hypothetical protein
MKSRAARLLGTKVRLEPDGPVGLVTNHAGQEGHLMLKIEFPGGAVQWAKLCDVTPAEAGD